MNENNINLIAEYNNEKICNFIALKKNINSNIYNDLICGFNETKLILLNFRFETLKENNQLKISLINKNNCIQINKDEIIFVGFKLLSIFNIKKFQKKLLIKMDGVIDCITTLRDGTIIQGGQKGIKRYLQNNFVELPILSNGYEDEQDYFEDYIDYNNGNELESILCLRELLDGRIAICYQYKAIYISKLNTF